MSPSFQVRAMMDADVPQVRDWMQSTPDAPRWSEAEGLLAPAPVTAGRERRGWMLVDPQQQPGGFLLATALHMPPSGAECELEYVYVTEALRGSGGGRALLLAFIRWARSIAAGEIWLEVRPSNTAARRLYAVCGFREAAIRPGYYQDPAEDALLMRLPISDGEQAETYNEG